MKALLFTAKIKAKDRKGIVKDLRRFIKELDEKDVTGDLFDGMGWVSIEGTASHWDIKEVKK